MAGVASPPSGPATRPARARHPPRLPPRGPYEPEPPTSAPPSATRGRPASPPPPPRSAVLPRRAIQGRRLGGPRVAGNPGEGAAKRPEWASEGVRGVEEVDPAARPRSVGPPPPTDVGVSVGADPGGAPRIGPSEPHLPRTVGPSPQGRGVHGASLAPPGPRPWRPAPTAIASAAGSRAPPGPPGPSE